MHQNVFLLLSVSRAGRRRDWDLTSGSSLMPDSKRATCKGHAVQSMWTCKYALQSAAHAVFVLGEGSERPRGCAKGRELRAGGITWTAGGMLMCLVGMPYKDIFADDKV
jgi:hypothetical protein